MLLSLRGRVVPGIVHVSTYLYVVYVPNNNNNNIQDVCAPIHKLVRKKIPDAALSQNHDSGAFGSKKIPDMRILHPGKNCQSFSSKYGGGGGFTLFFYPKTTGKLKKGQSVQYFF